MRTESLGAGAVTVLLAGLISTGCVDSGLPGENLPLEEARVKPPVYETYDAAHRAGPVHYDDLDWVAAGAPRRISDALLTAIPDAGENVFALATDQAPYERLYVRTGDGLVPLAPVPVQGDAPPAAGTEHD